MGFWHLLLESKRHPCSDLSPQEMQVSLNLKDYISLLSLKHNLGNIKFIIIDSGELALVKGFGKNHTVYLSRHLILSMPIDELKVIIAHELGHIALKHNTLSLIRIFSFSIIFNTIVLLILYQIKELIHPFKLSLWGVMGISITTIYVYILVKELLYALIVNPFERQEEFKADAFSISEMNKESFLNMVQSISGTTSNQRLNSSIYDAHPSWNERITFAKKHT